MHNVDLFIQVSTLSSRLLILSKVFYCKVSEKGKVMFIIKTLPKCNINGVLLNILI